MKLRIRFRKQGELRFIGHLDVMRYFQKVMRRAQVAIRYSEGFSPHQIMSFASPLSVGLISNGEYVDIDVSAADSSEAMRDRLNAAGVPQLQVLSVRRLDDSAKNAMASVAAADYVIWLKKEALPASREEEKALFEELLAFCKRPSVLTVKKTKKGEKEVDLKPMIWNAQAGELKLLRPAYAEAADAAYGLFVRLASGSAANVKPEQLLGAFLEARGGADSSVSFQIEREELYAAKEENGSLIPLEAFGSDF